VGPENDEQGLADEPKEKPGEGADLPSLEPVEPQEAEEKRPAWTQIPGTVKKTLMAGNPAAPLFQFHLRGGAVEDQGVRIPFLAHFLEAFRKVYEPVQVLPTGQVPQGNVLPATNAAPPMVSALAMTGSVTISFTLGPEELEIAKKRGDDLSTLQSVKAIGHLGALLSFDAEDDLLASVQPFGKRIGRSYGQLAEVLAENEVETDWWSDAYGVEPIEITAPEARTIADQLIHKPLSEVETYDVSGFMWDAATGDSKQRYVRIKTASRAIKASYDIPLTTAVTGALSHVVKAKIKETAYRFPFAEKAHRREWELVKLLNVGDSAGALAEWEQLQLEDTSS
jgi:hypothetical protein